jgi:glycosyltransferase involved in cell wall biosynthesis
VIGGGPEAGSAARLIGRLHLQDCVRMAGARDRSQIRAAFVGADAFVTAATLESFGIAALEARCAGLPVLAREGTGVSDFIRHDREGLLVASDAAMAEAIARIATSPTLRDRLNTHNRLVPPAITWADTLAGCCRLYETAGASGIGAFHDVPASEVVRAR